MFRRAFSTAAVSANASAKPGTRVFPIGINRVTLLGRVAREPKQHTSSEGETIVSSFTLQTSERKIVTSPEGETTSTYINQYHKIVNFDKSTHKLVAGMKPGMSVLVEGKLQHETYTDKDGNTKYSTSINPSHGNGRMIVVNAEAPEGWSGGKSSGSSNDDHFGVPGKEYPM
ncbi:hypothetical protein GGF32_000649 [Allomyces javanicus]|nr:hypothetical protein GGF32_000649 [Allomyces javanicus]